jgi:hypothetical protein
MNDDAEFIREDDDSLAALAGTATGWELVVFELVEVEEEK